MKHRPEIERSEAPGTAELARLVVRVAQDAIARGLTSASPEIPLMYRRVICLSDGSRIDVRLSRIVPEQEPACDRSSPPADRAAPNTPAVQRTVVSG